MRAAASLGAAPWTGFLRVYVRRPAGPRERGLVFVLALGYYVTPALVGGPGDQMIGYFIAYFTNTAVNWGMASALGTSAARGRLIYVALARIVGLRRLGPLTRLCRCTPPRWSGSATSPSGPSACSCSPTSCSPSS